MIDETRWPELKKAWDAYGHAVPFHQLHAIKSQRGCYAVVCWVEADGSIGLADLARGSRSEAWEMQNDGFTPNITRHDWSKLRIPSECDWFEIPGNEHYPGL